MKVAETAFVAREPVTFRELCARLVPEDARYVVFDLDKTLHFRRNIGELLGWELTAIEGYGATYPQTRGRWQLDFKRPLALLRYLAAGSRWVAPGLAYLFWCRIASAVPALRRLAFARFGEEPVAAAQRIPQHALFRQMARHPEDEVRACASRVLQRYEPDLIVERGDFAWLRARSPKVRLVLSSASPAPVVETAAESLGFDEAIFSTPERINSGRAKVAELVRRFPDLPRVASVGFSDNAYGEDAAWVSVFSHLACVNGAVPFSPLVPDDSPLRVVCAARVARVSTPAATFVELGRAELERRLAPLIAAANRAASAFAKARLTERAARVCLS